ncbi:integrase arm-type DNA-binding domain-containing protein [uncultured Sphingomonas sp.]|uniref:tyrosine-type recombinase/integrase n=1 Tax=uncultured Sphingomonas sp. TaxID=158754 RepID=UPI002597B8A1|nr:integrase arm-type DNA-binding domain-containing protein [uncultured Sphingomonas sp.]
MPLTDAQARKAPAKDKDYKLADSGGLYLFVTKSGYKSWRLKYRFANKERRLVIGAYPEISLVEARDERDRARRLLRDHRDPAIEERKRKMAAHAAAGATFEVVGKRWHEAQKPRWSPTQAVKVEQALTRDVYPAFGAMPLIDITGPMVLSMLRKVEKRGAIDTAKRIRQHVSAIFCFGIAEGLCVADPAAGVKKALLPTPIGGSQPGVNTVEAIRALHTKMDGCSSNPLTRLASRLLGLTFVRPGLIPSARWTEFEGIDWDAPGGENDAPEPIWRISADRMKLELEDKADEAFEHIAPLPAQAVEVLRAVRRLSGRFPYLFHSIRSTHEPMSVNTIGYMYNNNGYRNVHVPHGWRTSFSTIMNERAILHKRPDDRAIIDAMLSHKPKGLSGSEMAYNRALHMPRRWELAREWADLTMDGLAPAAAILVGHDRAA